VKEYDIAVIGAGPGGYVAAIRAAQAGACVCLIERDRVGGTCLNRGCIPTKALYASAHRLQQVRAAAEHGIRTGEVGFDFARAAGRKDEVVQKLVGGVEQLLKGNGVDLFRGEAALEGPGQVRIRRPDLTGHIRARRIILATGSVPAHLQTLPVDGKNVLTSDEILAIKELPESLLIVGGGYIGCEFAGIFATFGTRVTLLEQLPAILPRSDRQAVREVEKSFRELGVAVHAGATISAMTLSGDGVETRLAGGETLRARQVLVAAGRRPNTAGLALEENGVHLEKGAIVVDERMATSAEGVFAIGDVTGGIQLAHVASYQAGIAVDNALGGDVRTDYRAVPSSVFTFPEIGQVGLTEEECREKGLAVEVGRFAYQATSKALCDGEARGSVKVLAAREDGRLMGVTITGAEASTLLAEATLALQQNLTAAQWAEAIRSHPTLPETLREAAEDVEGRAVHKVGRRSAGRSVAN
jgi:dihydrolipoamide dehydrogenase